MESTSTRLMRKKKNVLRFASCCFAPHEALPPLPAAESPSSSSLSSPRSPVFTELAEMKQMCRSLINRFGKTTRRQSADFSYDPISYALNFEDARSDQLPLRKFPSTPTRSGRRLTREASRGVAAACG
ncbi:hypothetical protein QQ045_004785 [Rhodiola kirilowii]